MHFRKQNSVEVKSAAVSEQSFNLSNIILYCERWRETVEFYKSVLGLPVNIEAMHARLVNSGVDVDAVIDPRRGALSFFCRDPDGYRLEFWQPMEF
ncbi:MAG: hypothetical protein MAG794_01494 [Gammaproteobacteria bacterium]|nr:hypothetical protein [Gammaproteobacteria bacterium]